MFVHRAQSQLREPLIAGLLSFSAIVFAAAPPPQKAVTDSRRPEILSDYGNLPMSFEANRSQVDPSTQFISRGSGYSLFLTGSGAVIALGHPSTCHELAGSATNPSLCARQEEAPQDVVRMTLAGVSHRAAKTPKAIGEDELPGKVNYFLGKDPAKWRTNLPTYAKVRYPSVYPGVDIVYYGNQRQLEYDFIVAPGFSPDPIRLAFSGQQRLHITTAGDLILDGAHGLATFHKPVIFQQKDGRRQSVDGRFLLADNNSVRFQLGRYDHSCPLVIDPVLTYATYLGGSGSGSKGDQGNGIAVDASGNAYVVGTTYSTNFPLPTKSFQSTNNSAPTPGYTTFVTKLNAKGDGLLYSTYLGGSAGDEGYGIALDSENNAYITGTTYSTDFPVTCGAFQTENESAISGATEGFVTKLNPDGNALVYSTFLGGTGTLKHNGGAVAQAIAVSPAGDAFITGYTWSTDFPVTGSAFQLHYASSGINPNAFVTKLNRAGAGLAYSTYLGGGSKDFGNAIAVDTAGDAFVAGNTTSPNFPVTTGALQTTFQGSPAFVTELNPNGSEELYSTFLGGTGGESALAIAVDSNGSAFVAGNTSSIDFPVTDGALEGSGLGSSSYFQNAGMNAGFVSKLSKDGSALSYSTYLGGPGTSVAGLAVDGTGTAFLVGSAVATGAGDFGGFPLTTDYLSYATSATASFIMKLAPSGSVLNYSSLYGGSLTDGATAVAVDSAGNAYVTGFANSLDLPVTPGALQQKNQAAKNKASNAFVAKLALAAELDETPYPTLPVNVPTTLSIVSQGFQWDICDLAFVEYINLDVNTGIPGPPPTGTIEINNEDGGYASDFSVIGNFGGVTEVDMVNDPGEASPPWTAVYSGDSVYQPSTVSGSPSVPSCDPGDVQSAKSRLKNLPSHIELRLPIKRTVGASDTVSDTPAVPKRPITIAPRFTPAPAAISQVDGLSSTASSPGSLPTAPCIAPSKPPLTITLSDTWKYYGSPNPTLHFTVTGLKGADTVTVAPQTTATLTSPVGSYPITATVTGGDAVYYSVAVINTTLQVRKALLNVVPASETVTYGQTPAQPTAYTFIGFVNGDNSTVVSGAPILSTTVTSTTPAGYYPIKIASGTLAAANYYFAASSQAASVHVEKAPLTLTATSLTMPQGGPIPSLTYSYTGFVNGDTPATQLTGAPMLSTTATTESKPGRYPIYVATGTLTSNNYHITPIKGFLTVVAVAPSSQPAQSAK